MDTLNFQDMFKKIFAALGTIFYVSYYQKYKIKPFFGMNGFNLCYCYRLRTEAYGNRFEANSPTPPPKKIKKHSECSKSLDGIGRLSVKQFDQFDQQLRTVKLSQ